MWSVNCCKFENLIGSNGSHLPANNCLTGSYLGSDGFGYKGQVRQVCAAHTAGTERHHFIVPTLRPKQINMFYLDVGDLGVNSESLSRLLTAIERRTSYFVLPLPNKNQNTIIVLMWTLSKQQQQLSIFQETNLQDPPTSISNNQMKPLKGHKCLFSNSALKVWDFHFLAFPYIYCALLSIILIHFHIN